jgi:hypothetical protein
MKRMIFPLIFVICFLSFDSIYAGKWRVNNTGIPANFTTASEAMNSPLVLNGDTLYFEGSMTHYGNMTFVKKLVVIGPGYFLGENDSTQADLKPAKFNQVAFEDGSQGTIVKGMTILSWTSVNTSGITLERNNFGSIVINGGTGHVIIRNYISDINLSSTNNVLVANNIIYRTGSNIYPSISMGSSSATILNNIFLGYVYISNSVFRNNIQTNTSAPDCFAPVNCVVENNIGASTQFGTLFGNQQNVDMSAVFENTGSTDGKYILKEGSPAIGAGVSGTDCGIFGGNYPYALSGMVSGPSIWYLYMDGLDVTVKAKSN